MANAPVPGAQTRKKSWACESCHVLFDTFGLVQKGGKPPYCPSCGEKFDVIPYYGRKDRFSSASKVKIPWKKEETELCSLVIQGKMNIHEVVLRTGRSRASVKGKISDMKAKGDAT